MSNSFLWYINLLNLYSCRIYVLPGFLSSLVRPKDKFFTLSNSLKRLILVEIVIKLKVMKHGHVRLVAISVLDTYQTLTRLGHAPTCVGHVMWCVHNFFSFCSIGHVENTSRTHVSLWACTWTHSTFDNLF